MYDYETPGFTAKVEKKAGIEHTGRLGGMSEIAIVEDWKKISRYTWWGEGEEEGDGCKKNEMQWPQKTIDDVIDNHPINFWAPIFMSVQNLSHTVKFI